MIDLIPFTYSSGRILNGEYCIKYIAENRSSLFQNFPRIQNAFEIIEIYNFELIYSKDESKRIDRVKERKRLIKEVLNRIRQFDWYD